jgi:hypothetical protein
MNSTYRSMGAGRRRRYPPALVADEEEAKWPPGSIAEKVLHQDRFNPNGR